MATLRLPQELSSLPSDHGSGDDDADYTGVLIVNGLGHDERNAALQESLNALAYWFNHVLGLALRPDGAGRIWLRTRLTDDDRPDAQPSRATIALATPRTRGSATTSPSPSTMRLEFREIWWARSFGLPSATSGIRWARILYQQELFRILGIWLLRMSVPQRRASDGARRWRSSLARARSSLRRLPLRIAVRIYETAQALWKTGQWFAGMPLVFGLLFVLGVARPLQSVPGLSGVARGISKLVSSAWLLWIASMQVYLLDYTRSVAMRDRFERELRDLLQDAHCKRIVVVAYSIGTVLAYEGLTTVLSAGGDSEAKKPVTFVCVGQMLRRAWRLVRTDPHRLRGVLPETVRWVNIAARYDPIASGTLTARALPRVRDWADGRASDAAAAIRTSLARCENHIVVNRDSFLYDHDHASYWSNLEQVVGPIARELVSGNDALAALVDERLATTDDVLVRRWRIAWRSSIGLIAGAACGVETLLLGQRYHLGFATRTVVGQIFRSGADLPSFVGLLWRLVSQFVGLLGGWGTSLLEWVAGALIDPDQAGELTHQVVAALTIAVDGLIMISAAVGATTLVIMLIEQVLALPSPTKFHTPFRRFRRPEGTQVGSVSANEPSGEQALAAVGGGRRADGIGIEGPAPV
jgi:hypothetical protein